MLRTAARVNWASTGVSHHSVVLQPTLRRRPATVEPARAPNDLGGSAYLRPFTRPLVDLSTFHILFYFCSIILTVNFCCFFSSWLSLYLNPFTSGFLSSAGSEDEDDEGLDPAVKVVKEKERRQANNARER